MNYEEQIQKSLQSIKDSVGSFDSRLAQLQLQVDAIDVSTQERVRSFHGKSNDIQSVTKAIAQDESFLRLKENGRGRAIVGIVQRFVLM